MRWLRYFGYGLGAIFVTGCIAFLIGAWIYRDVPAEVLEAKYANAASRFITATKAAAHPSS